MIVGVAAANATHSSVLMAGAMSMAAGEYVSVSSQADTERADMERERLELESDEEHERKELTAIYVQRGLEPGLAKQVADQLMAKDALAAHLRDELGISEVSTARPIQAALTSDATTFAIGAALPFLVVVIVPLPQLASTVMGTSLLFLALLGMFQLILVVHGLASVLYVLSFGEHWQWH